MTTVESVVDGIPKRIEYSNEILPGIFFVDNTKQAKQNCQNFDILFEEVVSSNILQNKISKFKNFSFLTLKAHTEYIQHIIFDSASKEDIYEYAGRVQSDTAPLIFLAALPLDDINKRFRSGE